MEKYGGDFGKTVGKVMRVAARPYSLSSMFGGEFASKQVQDTVGKVAQGFPFRPSDLAPKFVPKSITQAADKMRPGDLGPVIEFGQSVMEEVRKAAAPATTAPAAPAASPRVSSPSRARLLQKGQVSAPAPPATQPAEQPQSDFTWFDGDTKTVKTGNPPAGYDEVGVAGNKGPLKQSMPIFAKSTTTDAGRAAETARQQKAFADFQARKRLAAQASRTPGGMDMIRRIRARDAAADKVAAENSPEAVQERMFGEQRRSVEKAVARDMADGLRGEAQQKTEAWNRGAAARKKLLMAEVKKRSAEVRSARNMSPLAPL